MIVICYFIIIFYYRKNMKKKNDNLITLCILWIGILNNGKKTENKISRVYADTSKFYLNYIIKNDLVL